MADPTASTEQVPGFARRSSRTRYRSDSCSRQPPGHGKRERPLPYLQGLSGNLAFGYRYLPLL